MKTLKRLGVFVVIAIIAQLGILIYINNFMLGSRSVFKAEVPTIQDEMKILIPENIHEFQSSFDGKYCSYYSKDTLYIIDIETSMRKRIEFKDGQTLSLYRWYNDSNKMILAEQSTANGAAKLKLTIYDADLGLQEDFKDLSWLGHDIVIDAVDFGEAEDLVLKVVNGGGRADLFYVGEEISKLSATTRNIGTMTYLIKEKRVIYQDKTSKKYYITGNKNPIDLISPTSTIIDVDSLGNLYLFDMDLEGKKQIYYKQLGTEDDWIALEVEEDIDAEDIYIDGEGNIYANNVLEGKITELKSKAVFTYSGKFMEFFKGGVFTAKDNELRKIEFNKEENK
ncbi:hypothetical protein [Clostridium thermarum]|uniref:hypothetical protein n=1 Tax=Clostridium thermarum TaxID=1716543 RepID=UPI001120CA28|nr:hypothetical protein [Clostridium thermarum]